MCIDIGNGNMNKERKKTKFDIPPEKRSCYADIGLLIAAISWGIGFIAGDVAIDNFPTFTVMMWRFLGGAALIGLIFRKEVAKTTKESILYGVVLGTILFCIQPFQLIALLTTSASQQGFLLASYAAMVPFFSRLFFKRRLKPKEYVAGIMVLIGIGTISLTEQLTISIGDFYTLIFSAGYAMMVILTGIFTTKVNTFSMTFFSFLTTGLLSVVAAWIFEDPVTEYSAAGVGAIIYLICINTALAYTLQNVCQRYTSDTHTAVLLSTDSLWAFVFGVFIFGEPFTYRLIIGGMIVLSAVLISTVELKPKTFHLKR